MGQYLLESVELYGLEDLFRDIIITPLWLLKCQNSLIIHEHNSLSKHR